MSTSPMKFQNGQEIDFKKLSYAEVVEIVGRPLAEQILAQNLEVAQRTFVVTEVDTESKIITIDEDRPSGAV